MPSTKADCSQGNKTCMVEKAEASAPGPGEVRFDVARCGTCDTDIHIYHAPWTSA